jgi:hypothetical protein
LDLLGFGKKPLSLGLIKKPKFGVLANLLKAVIIFDFMFPENEQLPDWMKIGETATDSTTIGELTQRIEYMVPEKDGALTRDGLCDVFSQIERDFYSRGASDEEAKRLTWAALMNSLNTRIARKVKGYLFELPEAVRNEIDLWKGFLDEFRNNLLEGRLGQVYPKREREITRI